MTRLKSKAFLVTTGILLVALLVMTNITMIIEKFSSDEAKQILIIDNDSGYLTSFEEKFSALNGYELTIYKDTVEKAKDEVLHKDAQGLLILSDDKEGYPQGEYFAEQISETWDHEEIEMILQDIKSDTVIEEIGLNPEEVALMNEPVHFQTDSLAVGAKTDEEANQARVVTYILTLVLYMTIMFYGNMIATDVATEKSSRVMELIVSSVAPVSHMFGKIAGILLLSVVQFLTLGLAGFLSFMKQKGNMDELILESFVAEGVSVSVILYALLFFILGYLLYATLAAMLGSLVSRVEDVSLLLLPMIFLIVIAFFIAMYGLASPSAKIITISSYIPFFAPIIMFLRVTMLNISFWAVFISIAIMIATIVLLGLIGSRIYRGGVLLYGSSNTFKDLIRVFHLTKKEK